MGTKGFAQVCSFVVGVLALTNCHYDEEQAWRECCFLKIVQDTAGSARGKMIVDWAYERMNFDPADGTSRSPVGGTPWQRQEILSAFSRYLADNPGAAMSAYFTSLGMTCRAAGEPKENLTRCEIDLPIVAKCLSLNVFYPFRLPVPKELREPFSAVLHVVVDSSVHNLLDVHSRIQPLPGGRLCHR